MENFNFYNGTKIKLINGGFTVYTTSDQFFRIK